MQPIPVTADIAIRKAQLREIDDIRAMQERSLLVLGDGFYRRDAIDAFIALVGTIDEVVVAEGHYFVAEHTARGLIGSAGWSQEPPGYERTHAAAALPARRTDLATVRSVFVEPAAARSGIATALMSHLERDAACHGISNLELMATLSGLPFYRKLGWRELGTKSVPLIAGLHFDCVAMSKSLLLRATNDNDGRRASA